MGTNSQYLRFPLFLRIFIYWNIDYILCFNLLKFRIYIFVKIQIVKLFFFATVRRNIAESLYKNGFHWPKQKYMKAIIMFIKIMLIKKDINNIFNILNKIIMHMFLLFIDIEFVIQFEKLQKYFKINHGKKA